MAGRQFKVLFISKRTDVADKIREVLDMHPNFLPTFKETAEAAMQSLTSGKLDCVMFNFDKIDQGRARLIVNIRQLDDKFHILLLTEDVNVEAVQILDKLSAVSVVDRTHVDYEKDVAGLCARLISGEKSPHRRAKRFPTNQEVSLLTLSSEEKIPGVLKNLSDGGGMVETMSSRFKMNDLVKLIIPLEGIGLTRLITAQVVWIKSPSAQKKGSIGIKFIVPESNRRAS